MAILLIHDGKDHGHVAMAEGNVAGEPTPTRHYRQEGSYLNLDAPPHALNHDLNELYKLGYRLATAEEQQSYTASKKKNGRLSESARKG